MKTIQVNGIIVHEDVLTTMFSCDYSVCKGECCYIDNKEGPSYEGCEITETEETAILFRAPALSRLLEKDGRRVPKKYTYKKDGYRRVKCDSKGRCCLLLSNGCALKVAQKEGLVDGNPISCHLYPIVITGNKRIHLRVGHYYDDFGICEPAYEKGKREKIHLIDFCREALIRRFGESFFTKLKKRADDYRSSHPEK